MPEIQIFYFFFFFFIFCMSTIMFDGIPVQRDVPLFFSSCSWLDKLSYSALLFKKQKVFNWSRVRRHIWPSQFFVFSGSQYAVSSTLSELSQKLQFPLITPVPRLKYLPVFFSSQIVKAAQSHWHYFRKMTMPALTGGTMALYVPITAATVLCILFRWLLIILFYLPDIKFPW